MKSFLNLLRRLLDWELREIKFMPVGGARKKDDFSWYEDGLG